MICRRVSVDVETPHNFFDFGVIVEDLGAGHIVLIQSSVQWDGLKDLVHDGIGG